MQRHEGIAAALTATLIVNAAAIIWWLNTPKPAPLEEESAYWTAVAMVERYDMEVKSAEKRCGGPIEVTPEGEMRCTRK